MVWAALLPPVVAVFLLRLRSKPDMGAWYDSTRSISANDFTYAKNRAKVDEWLSEKNLLNEQVWALWRVGPFALAYRYTDPPRTNPRTRQLVLRVPKIVWGWPL